MIVLFQMLVEGVAAGSLYALAAVGFALIYATTRTFHFAHGATMMLAAYAFYQAVTVWQWPAVLAVALAVAVAVAFGVGVERLVYQPMRRTDASFLTIFAASFGLLIVATNVVVLLFGNSFYSVDSTLSQGFLVGPLYLSWVNLLSVAVALVSITALQWFMRRTRTGVILRAMMDDAALVGVFGLGDRRYGMIAFAIGSALVAPAAILTSLNAGLQPSMGALLTLLAIAGAIVGGIGNLWGAALGGLLLGIAENIGVWQLSSTWKPAITFGVLLIFLMFKPDGLLGAATRRS
ncbi:branched-chain amino acid ABC transporter permease [Salinisphaera orenii]|uniref:ABC transporter permease n=1 Tax=Salinisphaera orenii YIM 95161 TaxID=1051139 RepID=A0A423PMR3_9GAMM|nr:branched-chain amino acid ABC transporter permease [Salinisphaera halophila]ROO26893.1 ABC transporter permease [Salinisphaera halophila YIM 95161]